MADIVPNLGNIQGNIFGGFSKDHRVMLFLHFTDTAKARVWLKKFTCNISTSEEVIAFNDLFKLIRKSKGTEGVVRSTWTNIAFTSSGLKALGVSDFEINLFPDAFRSGMAARAADLGDTGESAPAKWLSPFRPSDQKVHAVIIVESDLIDDINPDAPGSTANQYKQQIASSGGVVLLDKQIGATRPDKPGHEQFGFKDGVSQPGIRGVNLPDDPITNPEQGHPGQDLLHPGEFVLGYPTQIPIPGPNDQNPNPLPGDLSATGPHWTKDGSFLVYRRLKQDVKKFHENLNQLAASTGIAHDLMGAKLVGRYASGCPLERLKTQTGTYVPPDIDPGKAFPDAGNDDSINNFFEYGSDITGQNVPRAAHIRKAYPRDQHGTVESGSDTESRTQTHRLLRRGLPYGEPFDPTKSGSENIDRGLLFLCYQRDIEDQFEFVQKAWVNDPNFPCPEAAKDAHGHSTGKCPGDGKPDGQDPIIAQSATGPFTIPTDTAPKHIDALKHFVTTTGGDYFFSPSLEALQTVLTDPLTP